MRDTERVYIYTLDKNVITEQLKNRMTPKKLPCRMKADGSFETLEISEYQPVCDTSD